MAHEVIVLLRLQMNNPPKTPAELYKALVASSYEVADMMTLPEGRVSEYARIDAMYLED